MKTGDVIGLIGLATVLVLLLKNAKGTSNVIDSFSKGLAIDFSVLQGNTPTGVTYNGFSGGN